MMSQHKEFETF